jgi:hypothetical protein
MGDLDRIHAWLPCDKGDDILDDLQRACRIAPGDAVDWLVDEADAHVVGGEEDHPLANGESNAAEAGVSYVCRRQTGEMKPK